MRLNRENAYKLNKKTQVEEMVELSQEDSMALIQICSQYLDEQELESLKNNFERHFGEAATYPHRRDLKQHLKIIYSQMLQQKNLGASITAKIYERAMNCTPGFHSDCRQLVIDLCYSPKNIHDLLTRIRQEIVYKTAIGLSNDVHDINRVSLLASTSYGTHPTNVHDEHHYIDDEVILNHLAIHFEKKYERPFYILLELIEQFKIYIQSYLNYEDAVVNPHETQTLVDQFIQSILISHPNVIRVKQVHLQYEAYQTQHQYYLSQIQSVLHRHDFLFQQKSFLQYLLEPEQGVLHPILIKKSKDLSPEIILEIEEIKLLWKSFRSSLNLSSIIEEKNEAQEAYQQCFWNVELGELSWLEIKKAFFLEMFAQNIFATGFVDFSLLHDLHNHFSIENIVHFMNDLGLTQEDFSYLIRYFNVQSIHLDQYIASIPLSTYQDVNTVVQWFDLAQFKPSISFVTDVRVLKILKPIQFLTKSKNLFLKISSHIDTKELIVELQKSILSIQDLLQFEFLNDAIKQHFAKVFLQRENTFNHFHQLTPFLSKELLQEQIHFYFNHQEILVQKKFHHLWLNEMEFILKNTNEDKLKLILSKKKILKDYLEFFERSERLDKLLELNAQLGNMLLNDQENFCYFTKILSRENAFKLISRIPHPPLNAESILLLISCMPAKKKAECLQIFLPSLINCFLISSVSKFFEQLCPRELSEYEISYFANMYLKPYYYQYIQQSILNLPWVLKRLSFMEGMDFILSEVFEQFISEIKQPSHLVSILPQLNSSHQEAIYFVFIKHDICEIFDDEHLGLLMNRMQNIQDLPVFLIQRDFRLSLKNIHSFSNFIRNLNANKKIQATIYFLFKNNFIFDFAPHLNLITQILDNEQLSLFYNELTTHLHHQDYHPLLWDILINISSEDYELFGHHFASLIPHLFDNIDAYKTFLSSIDSSKRIHFIRDGFSLLESSRDLLDILCLFNVQTYPMLVNILNRKLETIFSNISDLYSLIKQLSPNSENHEQSPRQCFVKYAIPYLKTYFGLPSDIKKLKQLAGTQMSLLALKELELAYPEIDDYIRYFETERGMKLEYLYLKLYILTLANGISFFSQKPIISAADVVLKSLLRDHEVIEQELQDAIRILPRDIRDIFNSDEVSLYLLISETNTSNSLN